MSAVSKDIESTREGFERIGYEAAQGGARRRCPIKVGQLVNPENLGTFQEWWLAGYNRFKTEQEAAPPA